MKYMEHEISNLILSTSQPTYFCKIYEPLYNPNALIIGQALLERNQNSYPPSEMASVVLGIENYLISIR